MFNNKDGTIILLAFLILSGILLTAGLVATVVFQQLKMSKNIDNSILAFYAAEAGAERGLYLLREAGGSFECPPTPCVKTSEALGNGAIYDTNNSETTDSTMEISNLGITKNQSFQLDLYDPDNWGDSGIKSIVITEGGAGSGWAEVSWIFWDITGAQSSKTRLLSPSLLDGGEVVDFENILAHRVRIKALYENLSQITIIARDGGGGQVPIPGRIIIKSVGEYKDSNQALKVSFPREAPLYGLYDYVLFSEESLVK